MVAGLLAAAALTAHAPVVVHDAREASPLTGVRADSGAAVVYGRRTAGGWLQYWMYFADNPQDRGVLRTGRHAGDWELVQLRLDDSGRVVSAVVTQHSGAERCDALGECDGGENALAGGVAALATGALALIGRRRRKRRR